MVTKGMSGTERARERRRRRKEALRLVQVEVFEAEVKLLTLYGTLDYRRTDDKIAVANAVTTVLERAFAALKGNTLPELRQFQPHHSPTIVGAVLMRSAVAAASAAWARRGFRTLK